MKTIYITCFVEKSYSITNNFKLLKYYDVFKFISKIRRESD